VPQTVIDALAKEEEPAAKKDDDVVKTLTDAGLHDDLADEVDLNKIVEGEKSTGFVRDPSLSGDESGAETDEVALSEDQRLAKAMEKGKAGDTLGQINLQREIVGLAPFNSIEEYEAYEEAEQAKRVTEFGKDLTGGGVQDSGVGDTKTGFYEPDASSTGAYKYDPTSAGITNSPWLRRAG